MQYVFILGLVFACIFFLVMVILSAKTWRWLHVVATLFVFAMAVMYTAFVGISVKTRTAWKQVAENNEQRVTKLEADIEEATLGPEDSIRFGELSIKHLRLVRDREILGRGRVWRGCGPTNIAPDWSQVVVNTVPDSAADPANYPPNGIEVGSLLYAFAEQPLADKPYSVPNVYVGEFNVTAANDSTVTLQPNLIMADQNELNRARNTTWALYELMPQDRHDAFDDVMPMFEDPTIELPSQLTDAQLVERRQEILRRFPNLTQIFPDSADPQQQAAVLAAREAFIDRFAFDDLPIPKIDELIANDGSRVVTRQFDPPPEERWVLITLTQDLPEQYRKVDVDLEALTGSGLEGLDFGSMGRAIVRSLRQEHDSEVLRDDQLIVDFETAVAGYTDENGNQVTPLVPDIAKVEYDIYRRTLNDFEYEFHQLSLRMQFLERKIARVQLDIQYTDEAFNNAQAQITERERLQRANTDDIGNFQNDLDLVTARRELLERHVDAKRREINRLYAATRELALQKAQFEALLRAHIDEKTQQALDELDGQ